MPSEKGILITAPDGAIYHIPGEELGRYLVPPEEIEKTILAAEEKGFVGAPEENYESCEAVEEPQFVPVEGPQPATVINIFVGGASNVAVPAIVSEGEEVGAESSRSTYAPGSTMAKYAAGSTMAKYAAGSTMAKYAAGSTMAKYAAGSTMAKYAAGSTMAKYAAGSTIASPRGGAFNNATFYGDWSKGEGEE